MVTVDFTTRKCHSSQPCGVTLKMRPWNQAHLKDCLLKLVCEATVSQGGEGVSSTTPPLALVKPELVTATMSN